MKKCSVVQYSVFSADDRLPDLVSGYLLLVIAAGEILFQPDKRQSRGDEWRVVCDKFRENQ